MFCHPLGAVGHQSEEIPQPLLSRPAERAVLVHSWRQCGPPAMIKESVHGVRVMGFTPEKIW